MAYRITEEGREYLGDLGEAGHIGKSHVGLSDFGDVVMAGVVLGRLDGRGWVDTKDLYPMVRGRYKIPRTVHAGSRLVRRLDRVLGELVELGFVEVGERPDPYGD